MNRLRTLNRIQVEPDEFPVENAGEETPAAPPEEEGDGMQFMGMKVVRRRSAIDQDCKGDYIGVDSDKYLSKILSKQGDTRILFADYVLKFTSSGKMKKRILIITDFALYLLDPESDKLNRRIALAAVESTWLSNLSDNFFAIVVPSEYDSLMASCRKKEISDALLEATEGRNSGYQLDVVISSRFEYHAADDIVKEIECEEIDGCVKTRITKKEG
ncbi:hypothetical protein LUZ60_008357 [Juncus effusus]|nr:hypothetical protein LUZ60_008357 [Juncus effusus]